MPLPEAEPSKGRSVCTPWSFHTLAPNEKVKGHKAGEVVAAIVHHVGASKPCTDWLTKGEVPCKFHHLKREEWLGYFPMWAESGKPIVVGLREYSLDTLSTIALHDPVLVMKGASKTSSVSIVPWSPSGKFQTGREARKDPIDITDWLFTLWDDKGLSDWWWKVGRARVMGKRAEHVAPAPAAVASESDVRTMVARSVIHSAGGEQPAALASGAVDQVINRMARASANGTHSSKPK